MRRGDIVTVALPGAYGGKPRPALVVQGDRLEGSEAVIVCPITSDLTYRAPHRLELAPDMRNGLRESSLVMTDKLQAVPAMKCDRIIGRIDDSQQEFIDASLMLVLGLGD
jgi:mRNA interferase MazF